MEEVFAHLTRAKEILDDAINDGQTQTTVLGENDASTQVSDTDSSSGVETTDDNAPQSAGPNPDIATSSAGVDTVISEHEIAEAGENEEDEEGFDRVQVYEYDLGQYGDSLSTVDLSAIPGDAQLNLVGWDANGNAIISIGDDGVIITVEASASAYLAELQYGAEVGPLSVDVEALVGARADVGADFKINPMEGDFEVEIEAGVVVGATVNANGELDLKYMSVEAGATGIAGFAAEGHLEVGFDDWEFEFDAGGKLAFLLGGGVDVSFSVDGEEIVMSLANGAEVAWDSAGNAVGVVWDTGGEVLSSLDDVIPGDGVPLIPGI